MSNAIKDDNRVSALLAHSSTDNSASTLRVTADSSGNLHTSTVQNVVSSTLNSSTTNISASGTYTGSAESTLGIAGIQVMFKADQNCTVYVDQSPDGTNWDVSDDYQYNVIKDNFGITVQAVGTYFRVRVTNGSSTKATTTFRLHTVLCPVVEAVPRSLDNFGHFLSHVHGLSDHFGFQGQFTPMRDMKVVEPYRLIGTTFSNFTFDTNFWTPANNGTASTVTITNGVVKVTSGTGNSGYGQLQSVRSARFLFAQPLQFRGIFRASTVTISGNTRRWGSYSTTGTVTVSNGVFFELGPTGTVSLNCVSGGVINSVASGSFNGDVSEYTLDTNAHSYEIIYFTAGAWFYIDDVFLHKFSMSSTPLYQSLNVPLTFQSVNSASGTTSVDLESWNTSILRLGRDATAPTSKFQAGQTSGLVLKRSAGILHTVNISGVTNNSNVTLYDALSATGTPNIIWTSGAMSTNLTPFTISLQGVPFFTGLTLAITTADCNTTIIYE